MLLVGLVNNVLHKNSYKNPFFLYFKHKKMKLLKRGLSKRKHYFFKKEGKTLFYITPKTNTILNNVVSDKKTLSVINTPTNYKRKVRSITNIFSRGYKSVYFNYNLLNNINYENNVYFNIYDLFKGSLLYKASGGCYVEVIFSEEEQSYLTILLPSGIEKKISLLTVGTFGRAIGVFRCVLNKGGWQYSRVIKSKKKVRGIAMNPVDHPNGGRSNTKKPFLNKYNNIARFNK